MKRRVRPVLRECELSVGPDGCFYGIREEEARVYRILPENVRAAVVARTPGTLAVASLDGAEELVFTPARQCPTLEEARQKLIHRLEGEALGKQRAFEAACSRGEPAWRLEYLEKSAEKAKAKFQAGIDVVDWPFGDGAALGISR
jgi:hypothetical protein